MPAPLLARGAAWLIDGALFWLMPGLSYAVMGRLLEGLALTPRAVLRDVPADASLALVYGVVPVAFVLLQAALLATSGRTLGQAVAGVRVLGAAPLRALRSVVPLLVGAAVALEPWGELRFRVPAALAAWLLLSLEPLLARSTRTRAVADAPRERAFEPPRFSGAGFVLASLGIVAAGMVAGGVGWLFANVIPLESTEVDVPSIASAVAFPLVLALAGAVAAYRAGRFLVGELALTALLAALLAFEAMGLGLVPVPALQRFEVAGLLDFAVYATGLYFAAVLFLVLGSAVGFMVSSDRGADLSTDFERLVARRHLRLRLEHWALLAVIATLAPILVYGVVIWPVRAVWRLVRGQRVSRPLPPTVFMALLTIVGVMFGVTSLTVVLAVMGGFERDLKEKILGTNAHGVVHRYIGDFDEWRDVSAKVAKVPGIEGVTPFILSEVMITTDDSVTGAVLKGIDVETSGRVTDLAKNIDVENGSLRNLLFPERIPQKARPPPGAFDEPGEPPASPAPVPPATEEPPAAEPEVLPGVVIGREMARTLRVWIGDRVTVMNPLGELGPQGPIPRSRVYRVAAVFVSGMYEYDSKFAYITLGEAQKFFRMGDSVSGLEVRVANVDEARPLMKRVHGVLEGFPYRTKDWGEMNENLFAALRLERVVMFILLSFQVLIACICVIATLVMLVVEKRREVATLKAMGAREGSIMKLFVLEGLIIGAIGTFYGSAAGLLFCKLIEKYGVGLDPKVYYITRLPVVIEPTAFISVALVAMLLVFVATIYPARRGGSIAPVEGFREE